MNMTKFERNKIQEIKIAIPMTLCYTKEGVVITPQYIKLDEYKNREFPIHGNSEIHKAIQFLILKEMLKSGEITTNDLIVATLEGKKYLRELK